MQVKWLKRALQNLKEEADYIARDNPQAAVRIVVEIEDAVNLLADNPSLGRVGRLPGTRELVVADTPYLVPYRVRGTRIDILRVFHGRRRWPSQL
ncbi:MAG: type toxin-antitoxin system RelE/ParE family toxin [Hydrocarboniphaga sp.]|uniref:type II toxin-antitoxin system RelE/ParE family toxin n=1 Tax=Hydrocarboniphaga sp. TaxID=2033016 RepID=UPI0026267899|nr:type II toxin-antitoxin system RelE/ParE family toxin [Hydrocarboniphaga sp.]MDB5971625.1 type toxin-antitoxin system RelE/ParE family toxin [Hydrocarboniphaga sp.]